VFSGDDCDMTAEAILSALSGGAKTWDELPQIPNLDFVLPKLEKAGKVVRRMRNGVIVFSRFSRPEDPPEPKRKPVIKKPRKQYLWGPTKVCEKCGETRREDQFGWYGTKTLTGWKNKKRKKICHCCVYARKVELHEQRLAEQRSKYSDNNNRGSSMAGCHATTNRGME
jgi:hypothetical protein